MIQQQTACDRENAAATVEEVSIALQDGTTDDVNNSNDANHPPQAGNASTEMNNTVPLGEQSYNVAPADDESSEFLEEEGDSDFEHDSDIHEDAVGHHATNEHECDVLEPGLIGGIVRVLEKYLRFHSLSENEMTNWHAVYTDMSEEQWKLLQVLANFTDESLHQPAESFRVTMFCENFVRQHRAKFVGRLHTLQAMTIYSATRCKTACDAMSHKSAYPSYLTILNAFKDKANIRRLTNGRVLAAVAFDNNQKLGRTYRLQGARAPLSVVTTKVAALINGRNDIQFDWSLDYGLAPSCDIHSRTKQYVIQQDSVCFH
jgi:hypothetical protein